MVSQAINRIAVLVVTLVFVGLFFGSPILSRDGAGKGSGEYSSAGSNSTDSAAVDSVYGIIRHGFFRIENIFAKGCYDCHTDKTRFPWYHSLPLVKQFMDNHIKEARKHLDMSDGFPFGKNKTPAVQAEKLRRIKEEVQQGDMPLLSYRIMHWDAAPSDAEKDSLFGWIDHSLKLLDDLK
jgi:hypothetical protein